jgi:hypothetical protein
MFGGVVEDPDSTDCQNSPFPASMATMGGVENANRLTRADNDFRHRAGIVRREHGRIHKFLDLFWMWTLLLLNTPVRHPSKPVAQPLSHRLVFLLQDMSTCTISKN